jgi:hypothetical protein
MACGPYQAPRLTTCTRRFRISAVCGGVGIHGPSTNSGWLMLIVFIMSMPFGLMLLSLGIAKWLHQRKEEARRR